MGIKKILICDWDVHVGNGTQKIFYNNRKVLFFSVHRQVIYIRFCILNIYVIHELNAYKWYSSCVCLRFDDAQFYPGKKEGGSEYVGEGLGAGYNINVPWTHHDCSDSDYLYVWDTILLLVVKDFKPDIILVSAGFDAAEGDIMGECRVTPNGYATMLKKV